MRARSGYAPFIVMWPEHERRGEPRPHGYEIYDDGRRIGRLEWRLRPRSLAGWYLRLEPQPPERLHIDATIGELARDERSSPHDWDLNAELAAILSTAFALDAAERYVHPGRAPVRGRFTRGLSFGSYEIHVIEIEPAILARAVPELQLEAVADVVILAGDVPGTGLETALRRITLLGGRIVGVLRIDPGLEDAP